MKKALVLLGVVAFVVVAATSYAQFGSIKKGAGAGKDIKSGNVTGAVDKGLDIAIDADMKKCKNEIGPYHRNVDFNVTNNGPQKIESKFGPCKVSSKSDTYYNARCNPPDRKFSYVQTSCNRTNCSLYCYKK